MNPGPGTVLGQPDDAARRLALGHELQAAIASAVNFRDAFQGVLDTLCHHYGAVLGRVWRLEPATGRIREICNFGDRADMRAYFARTADWALTTRNSLVARAIETGQAQATALSELEVHGHFPLSMEMRRLGMVAQLIQPVRHMDERLAVVMSFDAPQPDLDRIGAEIGAEIDVLRTAIWRKLAEERLYLLGTALEFARDGVLITEAGPLDEPGPRIVYASPGICAMTGYRPGELLGRSPRMLQGTGTDRAALARIREALRDGRPVEETLLNVRKDGSTYWTEISITPVPDDTGRVAHFVSVQRDVTERRAAERAAAQAERLRAIGQIASGVAHDFNNLLGVIAGNLELLEAAPGAGQDLRERLGAALRATERGAALTRSLLAFARQQTLEPAAIDLNDLAAEVARLLERTLPASIAVRVAPQAGLWPCVADAAQMQSALLNLAVNARDAMPEGGMLELSTANLTRDAAYAATHPDAPPGDYVALAVRDTGTGIAPEVLARVFEPFFTTKGGDRGTGLGLSMVQGFVSQSRGHLEVESTPGRGTLVRLCLPRAAQAAGAPPPPEPPPRAAGRGTVLVVEDLEELRGVTCLMLEASGWRTIPAADAAAALAVLAGDTPVAVMLSDVVLPGAVDGVALVERARALRPGLAAVLMSGHADEGVLRRAGAAGAGRVLAKPFRRKALEEALGAVVDAR